MPRWLIVVLVAIGALFVFVTAFSFVIVKLF
jgi:hypothetical protein